MSKTTPGPWVIDTENNLIHALDDRHTIVCSFATTLKNTSAMADASLIAAAPDLLNALTVLAEVCVSCGIPCDAAIAAIAKAEGA
jgi:hypothetical protein